MVKSARRCVVLADGTKAGRIELARVCDLDQVGMLITGDSAGPAVLEMLDD
jgi:DeoR family transcriptional regulator of aga operon